MEQALNLFMVTGIPLIYLVAFVTCLVLSFSATDNLNRRKTARVMAFALFSLPVLAISGCWVMYGNLFDSPPTLAQLQKSFPKQRADLETVIRMSSEDSTLSRIAPDFLYAFPPVDPATGKPSSFAGQGNLSKARWDQYRDIYRRNGIHLGIERDQAGDAFIMVDSEGLLNRGHASGYTYCNPEKAVVAQGVFRYEPCTSNADEGFHRFTGRGDPLGEGFSFRKLADHWYAYDQGSR